MVSQMPDSAVKADKEVTDKLANFKKIFQKCCEMKAGGSNIISYSDVLHFTERGFWFCQAAENSVD